MSVRSPAIAWPGVLLVTLLVVEAGLQALYYSMAGATLFSRTGLSIYTTDPSSSFFNKPNLTYEHRTNEFLSRIYTNGSGLRVPEPGVEYAFARPPGKKRILVLGPSFAFGWGVDYQNSLPARLGELLDAEAINAGVPALGPYAQFRWYEDTGSRYGADVVVQVIYASMDVSRSLDDNVTVDERGFLRSTRTTRWQRVLFRAKRSALVFYAWSLSMSLSSAPAAIVGAGRPLPAPRPFARTDEDVRESLAYYTEFRDRVREAGAIPLVVYAPLAYLVHREDLARWRHLGVTDAEGQMARDRELCALVSTRVVRCLNLTPVLAAAAADSEDRLYYWLDIHWTPRGSDVAARAVAAAIEEKPWRQSH